MEIIYKELYSNWKKMNNDPYGAATFRYAENWANMMESEILKGKKLQNIAKDTSHKADTELITNNQFGCALSILIYCWIYGKELKQIYSNSYSFKGGQKQ